MDDGVTKRFSTHGKRDRVETEWEEGECFCSALSVDVEEWNFLTRTQMQVNLG